MALSRIVHLIRADANITVVAGDAAVHPEIAKLNAEGHIYRLLERNYVSSDLQMYEKALVNFQYEHLENSSKHYAEIQHQVDNEIFACVCCCIDDYELSTQIYYQSKYLRLPVNIADKPPMCDFYFGSMFNQDALQIMISTNGKLPRLSKLIKDQIARQFEGKDLNKAVENLGLIRERLRKLVVVDEDLISIDTRMSWIKKLTDFFDVDQWSRLSLTTEKVDKCIISCFPDFPTNDYEEFKRMVLE